MKTNKPARKYRSRVVSEVLNKITPAEKMQMSIKMALAARIDDLIAAKELSKSEFAEKMNKNPSEITKWLSGTQNFTIDTLVEIALALEVSVAELLALKQLQPLTKANIALTAEPEQSRITYYTPLEYAHNKTHQLSGNFAIKGN